MATEHSGEDNAARLRVGVIAGSTRPGRQSTSVAEWVCADPSTSLIRMHPRRIAAPDIHQHRPGWHARDIAVEKAGQ
jgi:hypothetical protein